MKLECGHNLPEEFRDHSKDYKAGFRCWCQQCGHFTSLVSDSPAAESKEPVCTCRHEECNPLNAHEIMCPVYQAFLKDVNLVRVSLDTHEEYLASQQVEQQMSQMSQAAQNLSDSDLKVPTDYQEYVDPEFIARILAEEEKVDDPVVGYVKPWLEEKQAKRKLQEDLISKIVQSLSEEEAFLLSEMTILSPAVLSTLIRMNVLKHPGYAK